MSHQPTSRHSVLVLVLAAVLLSATGPLAGASTPSIRLDDLSQHPSAKPTRFEVTNDVALSGLRWSHWGAPSATGTGALRINTCRPICAQGRVRVLQGAQLQVRGVRIDQGSRYYRQYRIVDPALSPAERAMYSRWTNAYVPSNF
ncbi:hypothetical protein [Streptantibioticus ferralitis]|uniref:Uncharacterized protein n=1 Tax=Streptantibioticus ferralitis TaxID=236510 RepID=A0ABT5YUP8_9ACTN|nr:hypothetical protein [Streptantibioticus ferralitis]MDF2255159.1 hypothetical protein [Streptantibioticus ferralitis]